jgi:hypothetical protein
MMWVDVDVCPKCGSTWHWLSYDELDFVGEGLSNATAPEYTYPVVIRTPFVTIIQENPLDVVIEALPGQPPDESVTSYWNEDFESCSKGLKGE